jgi:hypothetical protein
MLVSSQSTGAYREKYLTSDDFILLSFSLFTTSIKPYRKVYMSKVGFAIITGGGKGRGGGDKGVGRGGVGESGDS